MSTQLLLEGPILSRLLRLAAPNIVVVMVLAASSTFDAWFVGRLGPEALAGVSLVLPAWMLMVTMSAGGIGGGISSAIARALGAGRRAHADELVLHSLVVGLGLAAIFTVAGLFAGPTLYRAMGGNGATLDAAVTYSTILFSGAPALWLVNTWASVLRGSGDMSRPAIVVVAGELLHIGLAPVLIFGIGPIGGLGVAGAAISLVTSNAGRALALTIYVLSGRSRGGLHVRPASLHRRHFGDILRVGLLGSINTILTNANAAAVTGLVGSFGTFALAGYGLATRLEYLLIPLVFGLGAALVTMVGTNIGAGQIARARRIAWTGALLAGGLTGTLGLLVSLAPRLWVGSFSSEPEVLAAGESYLRVVGPTYVLFGMGLALYFASQGAGRLWAPVGAGLARLIVAIVGGYLTVNTLRGDLSALSLVVAGSFLVFGGLQAAGTFWTFRAPRQATVSSTGAVLGRAA
ncbi:MAG TPA: MATE family efflux transporter [Chloroflexota bacterium]|jgi:putative MATE family efflux protein|nr:MATE family efflux transporter [Chloroflexota bacterium]